MNYGKIAMLHRMAGGGPITIYRNSDTGKVDRLYAYFQEICNQSSGIMRTDSEIMTRNPMLAYHLKEEAEKFFPQRDPNRP